VRRKAVLLGLCVGVAACISACGGSTKTVTQTETHVVQTNEVTVTAPQRTVTETTTVP
jgi:hypothetical protein